MIIANADTLLCFECILIRCRIETDTDYSFTELIILKSTSLSKANNATLVGPAIIKTTREDKQENEITTTIFTPKLNVLE